MFIRSGVRTAVAMKRVSPLLLAVLLTAGLPLAGPETVRQAAGDHDLAREAVQKGEILPLERILERARDAFPGEMLAVELEEERHEPFDGRLIYEVKILADDGTVTELYYDARTGDMLKARGAELENHEGSAGDAHAGGGDGDEDDGWDWFGGD